MASIDRLNDGSQRAPYLRRDLNIGTLLGLPRGSSGFKPTLAEQLRLVKDGGHVAVQSWNQWDDILAAGLRATGMARITRPVEADAVARTHRQAGLDATTLHVGDSFESDAEMDALVGAVLEAAERHGHPFYIETHRATITQDIKRTIDLIGRFPTIRFNADLSHWYTGHELTYGGEFFKRIEYLQPVFDRVRFMHARIGNTGAIQTALDLEGPCVMHHRLLWQRCFRGFLDGAAPGDYLSFNAELLPMRVGEGEHAMWIHYAQTQRASASDPLAGEPSDRFADAALLWQMASAEFDAAVQTI